MIHSVRLAAEPMAASAAADSAWPRLGRESSTMIRDPGASANSAGSGSISNASPPAWSHPSEKTTAISQAAGPVTRTWVSRQVSPGLGRRRNDPYSSPMFMPPVKATSRSRTRILRWSRNGWYHSPLNRGWKSRTSMPELSISCQNSACVAEEPRASASTRTVSPRSAAAFIPTRNCRPVESSLKM